jgi:hypothetical protein
LPQDNSRQNTHSGIFHIHRSKSPFRFLLRPDSF